MLRDDSRRGGLSICLGVFAQGDARAVPTDGGNFDRHGIVRHHDVGVDSFHTGCPRKRLFTAHGQKVMRYLLMPPCATLAARHQFVTQVTHV